MSYKCVCSHTTEDHPLIPDESRPGDHKFSSCNLCTCQAFDMACQACGHDIEHHDFCVEDSKIQCSDCKCRVYIGG